MHVVRATDEQPHYDGISEVRLDHRSGRIAVSDAAEKEGGVATAYRRRLGAQVQ